MNELRRRTCLITGATSGIGRATATRFARLGATVVLGARDECKGEATCEEIRAEVPKSDVHVLGVDLASLTSVRAAANDFAQRFSRLHVLINNAGVSPYEYRRSVDGFEMAFATNHLGHFALTLLLLDVMRDSAPARIIQVASQGHAAALDLDELQAEQGFDAVTAYRQSKLCNILFARELAKRVQAWGITVNAFDPGAARTDLGRDLRGMLGVLRDLARPFQRDPRYSAAWLAWLATAPELAEVTGRYFVKRRETQPKPGALDDEAAQALWELSKRLTGMTPSVPPSDREANTLSRPHG